MRKFLVSCPRALCRFVSPPDAECDVRDRRNRFRLHPAGADFRKAPGALHRVEFGERHLAVHRARGGEEPLFDIRATVVTSTRRDDESPKAHDYVTADTPEDFEGACQCSDERRLGQANLY